MKQYKTSREVIDLIRCFKGTSDRCSDTFETDSDSSRAGLGQGNPPSASAASSGLARTCLVIRTDGSTAWLILNAADRL